MIPQRFKYHRALTECSRFALGGSFQIFVFVGDFSDDPQAWPHDPHLVGIDGIFATRNIGNCDNCRNQQELGLIDSDVISLTTVLIAYWKTKEAHCGMTLESLDPRHVIPFLRYNLHWRVLDVRTSSSLPHPAPFLFINCACQEVSRR